MPDILRYAKPMDAVDRDQMIGPDFGGRYLGIKSVDGNTVTLRGIMPPEFRERVTKLAAGQAERERIRKVFNG